MLESLSQTLVQTIGSSFWLAPLAALLGGMLTAANPCVLASIPLMMGYVAGQDSRRSVLRSFLLSLTFTIGLTLMYMLMFMTTLAVGSLIPRDWWLYVAAAVCLLMGLHLLGVVNFRIPAPAGVQPSRKGFLGALLLGLLFGLVSIPCAGPILGALLSLVPLKGTLFGGMLLVAYSIGHCALILVGGTSVGLAQKIVSSRGIQGANTWFRRVAGLLIIGVALFLLLYGP